MESVKVCCVCKESKELDCFSKTKGNKDGLSYKCKTCVNQYCSERRIDKKIWTIYRFYDNDKLLYIGCTENPANRKLRHLNGTGTGHNKIFEYKNEIMVGREDNLKYVSQEYEGGDKSSMLIIERNLIKELKPLLNLQHNPKNTGKETIGCFCGGRYDYSNKSHHNGSKIHKKYLDSLAPEQLYEITR